MKRFEENILRIYSTSRLTISSVPCSTDDVFRFFGQIRQQWCHTSWPHSMRKADHPHQFCGWRGPALQRRSLSVERFFPPKFAIFPQFFSWSNTYCWWFKKPKQPPELPPVGHLLQAYSLQYQWTGQAIFRCRKSWKMEDTRYLKLTVRTWK